METNDIFKRIMNNVVQNTYKVKITDQKYKDLEDCNIYNDLTLPAINLILMNKRIEKINIIIEEE